MKKLGLVISALLMLVLSGCQPQSTSTKDEATVKIEILVQGENVTDKSKTIQVVTEEDVLDAMKDNFDIVEKDGLITAIAGIESDKGDNAGRYWKLVVNGEMSMVGAKDVKLKDGDVITFDLTNDWN